MFFLRELLCSVLFSVTFLQLHGLQDKEEGCLFDKIFFSCGATLQTTLCVFLCVCVSKKIQSQCNFD